MAAIKINSELRSTPLLVARVIPTLDWPESLQPWLAEVLVFMVLFALLATSLRIYSRRLNNLPLWWDDWLAIGNMCWFVVVAALMAAAVALGLGLHWQFVPDASKPFMIQVALSIDIMYLWCLVWSKLSMLLLYYRVFRFGYFKRACWVIAGVVVVWAIVSTISLLLLCMPLAKFWEPSLEGHCSDPAHARLYNSIATIVTDIMILCLPIPQIWKLHGLQRLDKIGLTALFALGLFVVSIAGFRIAVQRFDDSTDRSFSLAPDAGWLTIEIAASIVSASFPAMGPALIEMWHRMQHGVSACRGRGARGRRAAVARSRQGGELRTRCEEVNGTSMSSPQQQHPDEVDGVFHRLYSKGQNGSAVTHVGDHGEPLPSRDTANSEDKSSTLRNTAQSVGSSEELPLNVFLAQTAITPVR